MSLEEVVNVQISVEEAGVSRASFGTMLFLGLHKVFTDRVRTYTSVQGLLDDGFDPDSDEVAVATAVFSQAITPVSVMIGRRHSDSITSITPDPVTNSAAYSVTINGTEFSVNSDTDATDEEIVDLLVAEINGGSEPVTATDDGGSLSIAPDVAGTDYSLTTSENLTVVVDDYGAETLTTALSEIRDVDDDWYALVAHTHVQEDVVELAGQIETLKKIYLYSTADSDVLTTATDDVMSELADSNYDRTAGLYDPDADTAFPEAAWLGVMLPKDPGSATWAFKTLVGQDADKLTTTQSQQVRDTDERNGNTYETIGGVDITRFGTVHSGEYLDVIRGIDWLESRLEERIYGQLVAADKIPYTQEGVTLIENQIRAQLLDAIDQGVLAADPTFTITVPTVSEISSAVKATRALPNITFTATLAGAIHKVTVIGTVTV